MIDPLSRLTLVNGRPTPTATDIDARIRRGRLLRITEHGESVLHRSCRAVTDFGVHWSRLIDDMFATMWAADGCGLAANQVGEDIRLFVYDLTDEHGVRHVGQVFNPVIHDMSTTLDEGTEGCLSVPGATAPLARPHRVRLDGQDLTGNPITLTATGYLARCLQHETQHLDGRLYIDLLAPAARRRALARSAARRDRVMADRADRGRRLTH